MSAWKDEENNILMDAWKHNIDLSEKCLRTDKACQYHVSKLLIHE